MSPVLRRFLLVLAVGTLLAACGGGNEAPSAAEDKARAERALLTQADVPALTEEGGEAEEAPAGDAFDDCVDGNQLLTVLTLARPDGRGAESSFSNDDQTVSVASVATFAENESEARSTFALLRRRSFTGCLESALRAGFEAEIGDAGRVGISISDLPIGPVGDELVAYRAAVELEGGAQPVAVSIDFVFLRMGRALASLAVFDLEGGTFDAAVRNRLSEVVAGRLDNA